jgi:hypothetical protein
MITTENELDDLSVYNDQPLVIKTTLLKTDIPRKIGNRIIEDSIKL